MYNRQLRQPVLALLLLWAEKEEPPMKVKREKAKERKPKDLRLLRPNHPKTV